LTVFSLYVFVRTLSVFATLLWEKCVYGIFNRKMDILIIKPSKITLIFAFSEKDEDMRTVHGTNYPASPTSLYL
jgi:hypothetical protein